MRCTRCLNVHLTTEDFRGQIIDACPRCHGVWLSREDFERLTAGASTSLPVRSRHDDGQRDGRYHDDRRSEPYADPRYDQRYDRRSSDSSGRLPVQGRRRSWLHGITELFD